MPRVGGPSGGQVGDEPVEVLGEGGGRGGRHPQPAQVEQRLAGGGVDLVGHGRQQGGGVPGCRAAGGAQPPRHPLEVLLGAPAHRPGAPAAHQAGPLEDGEVVGDVALVRREAGRQLAHRGALVTEGEQQAHPGGVGQGAQPRGVVDVEEVGFHPSSVKEC